jgi:hypothetical protein
MTSMDAMYGDETSPDLPHASLADSPNPITARTESAPRAKPVKRTYGSKKVEIDAPPTAPEATKERTLAREPTMIVPETDFDAVGRTSSPDGDRTLMQSGRRALTSSSPTRRDVHSTDPTSEDDGKSDGESSSESEAEGAAAFLARPNIKDLLADIDRDIDSRPNDPLPTPAATRPSGFSSDLTRLNTTQPSSTLPPLTPSDSAASTSSRHLHSADQAPTSESILDEIAAALPPVNDSTASSHQKKPARIMDSEEEEEEEVAPQPSRKGKQRAVLDSSDAEEEEASNRASSPASSRTLPSLSSKERVAALVAKKRKDLPPVQESRPILEDTDDMIEGDDARDAGSSKKRRAKKSVSKQPRVKVRYSSPLSTAFPSFCRYSR